MRLKVITPVKTVLDCDVVRIVAEAPNGSFGMLPQHIDYVSSLVPGILTYETEGGDERFLGVNAGTLVKCGSQVLVSVLGAIVSTRLEELEPRVVAEFRVIDEEERAARSALARLEAGMVRRFFDLERESI